MIILSKYEPNIFSYANVTPQCKLLITISLWICPHTNTARNHELAYRSLRCPNRTSTHKQRIKDITPHQSISPERTFQTPIQSVLYSRLLWFRSKEAALQQVVVVKGLAVALGYLQRRVSVSSSSRRRLPESYEDGYFPIGGNHIFCYLSRFKFF